MREEAAACPVAEAEAAPWPTWARHRGSGSAPFPGDTFGEVSVDLQGHCGLFGCDDPSGSEIKT